MTDQTTAGALSADDQSAIEQAHAIRDGSEWFFEKIIQPFAGGLESTAPQLEPSSTPISDKAFNMIVMFEVSSQAAYQAKYQHPIWPGGASGVTIGIGYDVGYVSQQLLGQDWQGAIPDAVIQALRPAIGVRGASAQGLAQSLQATVTVPWTPAITVHRTKVIPKWITLVQKYLSNTDKLDGDCLGALVSLTYNRGASFDQDGDRFTEMRNIRADMASQNFADIPGQIRSMKRLWPTVRGLQIRRDSEAALFEAGLAA
jgi:GH24 family phage-related lysozyme (muramidase)